MSRNTVVAALVGVVSTLLAVGVVVGFVAGGSSSAKYHTDPRTAAGPITVTNQQAIASCKRQLLLQGAVGNWVPGSFVAQQQPWRWKNPSPSDKPFPYIQVTGWEFNTQANWSTGNKIEMACQLELNGNVFYLATPFGQTNLNGGPRSASQIYG